MKRLLLIFIIGMALLVSSCEQQTQNPAVFSENHENTSFSRAISTPAGEDYEAYAVARDDNADSRIQQCILLSDFPDWPSAYFELNHAEIDGNILSLTVSYPGGCMVHDFKLVVFTSLTGSDQLQISMRVFHTPTNDYCDLWITEVRKFDISPLSKFLFDRFPGANCLEALISIQNTAPEEAPLPYLVCRDSR